MLIDEATAVLDPFIRSKFMIEIDRLNKKNGMTSLIATNIGTEIAALEGRLIIMRKGKIVIDRSTEKIVDGYTKIRVTHDSFEAMTEAGFSFTERNNDDTYSFLGPADALQKLQTSYQHDHRKITVDEIFIYFSDRKIL